MRGVLPALLAELLQLYPVLVIPLILCCRIIPGLAVLASQGYDYSGIGSH